VDEHFDFHTRALQTEGSTLPGFVYLPPLQKIRCFFRLLDYFLHSFDVVLFLLSSSKLTFILSFVLAHFSTFSNR
jgi:hypothetical protein